MTAILRHSRPGRRGGGDRRSSAPTAAGCPAPPPTSSSPRAPSAPGGMPPPSRANTSRQHRFSVSPDWSPSTAPTRCGTRSASPRATSACCCSWPRHCVGRVPTRCPTSPSSGSAPRGVRTVAMLVVVVICVLYLVPQYQGAGLTLKILLGVPVWVGPVVVGAIVIANVVGGGMRSITFVQAFQYWLKLTAIAVPALALTALFLADRPALGGPLPPTVAQQTTVAIEADVVVQVAQPAGVTVDGVALHAAGRYTLHRGSTLSLAAGSSTPVVAGAPASGDEWLSSGDGLGGKHPLYQVLSLIVATFLGTMGLPHVLVRFYTNPDGRAARRTALAVIALLSVFYVFPTLLGMFARLYVPQLLITGAADAAVLLLPGAAIGGAGGHRAGGAGGRWCDRRVPGHVVGSARQHRRRAGHRCAAGPGTRLPVGRPRRRPGTDPAGAGGVLPGVVAQRRTGVRGRRIHAVSASGAGHLVARADRCRSHLRPDRRRCAVRAPRPPWLSPGPSTRRSSAAGSRHWWATPRRSRCRSRSWRWWWRSRLTASTAPVDVARIFARMHVPERLGMGVERVRLGRCSTTHDEPGTIGA